MFVDEPYSYTNGPSINNWDGKFMGNMTTRRALSLSRNIPALKAFQQVDNSKILMFLANTLKSGVLNQCSQSSTGLPQILQIAS